jgi:hypothetical protein
MEAQQARQQEQAMQRQQAVQQQSAPPQEFGNGQAGQPLRQNHHHRNHNEQF